MPSKPIPEKDLTFILSQLSSIDARDAFILKLLELEVNIPKSMIEETAYHFVQKNPLKAAELYEKAGNARKAFEFYLKANRIFEAEMIIKSRNSCFSRHEIYHFYEAHARYNEAYKLAVKDKNIGKMRLYVLMLKNISVS